MRGIPRQPNFALKVLFEALSTQYLLLSAVQSLWPSYDHVSPRTVWFSSDRLSTCLDRVICDAGNDVQQRSKVLMLRRRLYGVESAHDLSPLGPVSHPVGVTIKVTMFETDYNYYPVFRFFQKGAFLYYLACRHPRCICRTDSAPPTYEINICRGSLVGCVFQWFIMKHFHSTDGCHVIVFSRQDSVRASPLASQPFFCDPTTSERNSPRRAHQHFPPCPISLTMGETEFVHRLDLHE